MAVAIKLSKAVEISTSDCDKNGKSPDFRNYLTPKSLPDRVSVRTSPNIARTTNQQAEALSSNTADDVSASHGILKRLLEKNLPENGRATLSSDNVLPVKNHNSNIKVRDKRPKTGYVSRQGECLMVDRLQTHKQIEQRRRYELSKNLDKLECLVCPDDNNRGKIPQLCVLTTAITKVKSLKQINKKLMRKRRELSAYHKQLCRRLAELGHPVESEPPNDIGEPADATEMPDPMYVDGHACQSVPDKGVRKRRKKELKHVITHDIPNNSGPDSSALSPSQPSCDSLMDTDNSEKKFDSELASSHSEITSASDKADCDQSEAGSSTLELVNCDQTDFDPSTLNQSQTQSATGSSKSESEYNPDASKANQFFLNHDPEAFSADHSVGKSLSHVDHLPLESQENKAKPKFPSLLGKMFEDVENSLQRRAQEDTTTTSDILTATDKTKKPVSLSYAPSGGLVLTKCNSCDERVAFSDKIPGLVICPACSCVIVHFTPDQLQPKQIKAENPSPLRTKPLLATKQKKPSTPEVIDLGSDSDHENNHQEATPSRVTPSDVLDILKDGVRGYVDNVDGDEVIVVLK